MKYHFLLAPRVVPSFRIFFSFALPPLRSFSFRGTRHARPERLIRADLTVKLESILAVSVNSVESMCDTAVCDESCNRLLSQILARRDEIKGSLKADVSFRREFLFYRTSDKSSLPLSTSTERGLYGDGGVLHPLKIMFHTDRLL